MDDNKNIGESIEGLGGALPDGRTVDVIKDDSTGQLKLLCFDGTQYRTQDHININGRAFVSAALDPAIQTAVTFPKKVMDYGCTKDLFDTIRNVFVTSGMSLIATAVTYFVFWAWFPEPSAPAPCLIITGPGAEAAVLLQLLACMVRRSLLMAELDLRGFRGLVQDVRPTVLMDASFSTARGLHRLLASCGFGCFAPWKGSVTQSSFARVIYAGVALPEDVPTAYAIRVHLSPSPRGVSLLDEEKRDQITTELQAKLLDYRLRNLTKIRASTFDLPELDLEARTIGRSLGRILDDSELQDGVRSLLGSREDELSSARWTDPTCVVIETMLDKSHSPQPGGIYVGEVAKAANALLQARGAGLQLKARGVGDILRHLGFTPKPNSRGNRVLVTSKFIQLIHGLARDYRVAAVEQGIARCAVCREAFAVGTEARAESP